MKCSTLAQALPFNVPVIPLALLWALVLGTAQADVYQAFADGGNAIDSTNQTTNTTGQAFGSSEGGLNHALAVVSPSSLFIQVSDQTHWTLGPYANSLVDYYFDVPGVPGTATYTFNFQVQSNWDLSLAHDFNTSVGFEIGISTYGDGAGPWPYANGSFVNVNCIGCGGNIYGGSIDVYDGLSSPAPSTAWAGENLTGNYSLTATFGTGTDTGRLRMSLYGGAGSTSGNMSLQLMSIIDQGGQAFALTQGTSGVELTTAVPIPAAWSLMLSGGLFLFGSALRRSPRLG